MTEFDIRRTFFYAMQEASMFDATIGCVAPYYREMHEMLVRLAVDSLPSQQRQPSKPILALDIGSGTGAEAIALLRKMPDLRLIGLDLCKPMNAVFAANAAKEKVPQDRFRLIEADILQSDAKSIIQREGTNASGSSQFQLVTSAFTIHHFDKSKKREIFGLIHDLLEPGGIFILGDLFNYVGESSFLTQTIFNWELGWIDETFESAAKDADSSGHPLDGEKLRNLRTQWLDHYLKYNQLDSVTFELNLLKEVGFSEMGNPFRYWQVGLIWAKK